jgi:hypothetical protein
MQDATAGVRTRRFFAVGIMTTQYLLPQLYRPHVAKNGPFFIVLNDEKKALVMSGQSHAHLLRG